jgi:hypothetical protein
MNLLMLWPLLTGFLGGTFCMQQHHHLWLSKRDAVSWSAHKTTHHHYLSNNICSMEAAGKELRDELSVLLLW